MRWLPIPELSSTLKGVSPNTQALRISGATRQLDRLATLSRLVSLDVENPDSGLLQRIGQLTRLQHLVLEPFRLDDLTPLSALIRLRSLTLSSGGWGRVTHVQSFKPLAAMTELQSVSSNLVPDDGDLSPLAASTKMREINLAPGNYAMANLASLAACLRPQDRTGTLSGAVQLYSGGKCARCGTDGTLMLLSGKRSGSACAACQQEKLQRHLNRWGSVIEQFRAANPSISDLTHETEPLAPLTPKP